jgi:hypothetical protein
MDSFDRNFNRGFTFFKVVFVAIFLAIIGAFIFKIGLITDAKRNNKAIYQIEVNNYNHIESYTTTSYERDKESDCIKFKDEFGMKHIVCNNYTITEY